MKLRVVLSSTAFQPDLLFIYNTCINVLKTVNADQNILCF